MELRHAAAPCWSAVSEEQRPTWSLALLTDCSCGITNGASLCRATASMLREMRKGLLTGSAAAANAVGENPAAVRRMSSAGSVPVIGLQHAARCKSGQAQQSIEGRIRTPANVPMQIRSAVAQRPCYPHAMQEMLVCVRPLQGDEVF